jgi:hypothetical protein
MVQKSRKSRKNVPWDKSSQYGWIAVSLRWVRGLGDSPTSIASPVMMVPWPGLGVERKVGLWAIASARTGKNFTKSRIQPDHVIYIECRLTNQCMDPSYYIQW